MPTGVPKRRPTELPRILVEYEEDQGISLEAAVDRYVRWMRQNGSEESPSALEKRYKRWRSGEYFPQPRFQRQLADYLGMPISEFFPDRDGDVPGTDRLQNIEGALELLIDEGLADVVGRLEQLQESVDGLRTQLGGVQPQELAELVRSAVEEAARSVAAQPGRAARKSAEPSTRARRPSR